MGGSTRTGLLFFLVSLTTAGCEKGDTIDGAALAKEVCACTEKANAMDGSDPGRPLLRTGAGTSRLPRGDREGDAPAGFVQCPVSVWLVATSPRTSTRP